jgi:hypothetical protein
MTNMLRTLGPSGLLRLATAIMLALSLLTGCAAAIYGRPLVAAPEADESGSRGYRDHSAAPTVVCLQP